MSRRVLILAAFALLPSAGGIAQVAPPPTATPAPPAPPAAATKPAPGTPPAPTALALQPSLDCTESPGVAPPLGPMPMAKAAAAHGLRFGTGAGPVQRAQYGPTYRAVLVREFSILMPEDEMKWDAVRPDRASFDFSRADCLMELATAHGLVAMGGPLVWHSQLPKWLQRTQGDRDEFIALMREHIHMVIGHYRERFPGRIVQWEVVNEPLAPACPQGRCTLRGFWAKNIGREYIELAFRFAREADPDAQLFLNEIGLEQPGPTTNARRRALLQLVDYLQSKDVPLDGIGLQGHISISHELPRLGPLMQQIADRDLDVMITELDVQAAPSRVGGDVALAQQKQAAAFRSVLEDCLDQPRCKTFVIWGFTDRRSWLKGQDATPLNPVFEPKPAWGAMLETLMSRKPQPRAPAPAPSSR